MLPLSFMMCYGFQKSNIIMHSLYPIKTVMDGRDIIYCHAVKFMPGISNLFFLSMTDKINETKETEKLYSLQIHRSTLKFYRKI